MGQHEQKIDAIEWLKKKAKECKSDPCRRFSPKQVAEGIGGSYTVIGGKVAEEIAAELSLCGVPAEYTKGRKRFFVLK